MSFVLFKFLHVAFMFMGTALAVGPAALLYRLARSGDASAIRQGFALAERVFQVSTACYALGIVTGVVAAMLGALDLTASWLLLAYVLVGLLGVHGILFDRWTKRVSKTVGATGGHRPDAGARAVATGRPLYLLSAMAALVVAIVYVMVVKPGVF